MPPVPISCQDIYKSFEAVPAVDGLSFTISAGAILTLLGPSGCGKTTILRLVAGFERLDKGQIEIGGTMVAGPDHHLAPERRRIGMAFQDYAIFPHLNVADNVGFGLNDRNDRPDKKALIESMLAFVGLESLGERMPYELSGGQQQRVALARALAPGPPCTASGRTILQPGCGPTQRSAFRGTRYASKKRDDDHLRHPRPGGSHVFWRFDRHHA